MDKSFKEILRNIDNEEYDKCSACATDFLERPVENADSGGSEIYYPYAKYFKIFAEAYRIWQISYTYTDIRYHFNLASFCLKKDIETIFGKNIPKDHKTLIGAFAELSKMLCAYTQCENSFINNDPFSLEVFSQKAIDAENAALDVLNGSSNKFTTLNPTLTRIREWIINYLEKNRYLHIGLNKCATVYKEIFEKNPNPDISPMKVANEAYIDLQPLSAELGSELHAHIHHITEHYEQLKQRESSLRVSRGSLVLALSATCNDEWIRERIYGCEDLSHEGFANSEPIKVKNFREKLEARFNKHFEETFNRKYIEDNGIVTNYRQLKLHDIFETIFGKPYLQNISFNLPDIRVSTLADSGKYVFNTSVTVSSLGVCTVFFTLDLESIETRKDGLYVEEIRLLQSSICPHAAEVKLDFLETSDKDSEETAVDDSTEVEERRYEKLLNELTTWLGTHKNSKDKTIIADDGQYVLEIIESLCADLNGRGNRSESTVFADRLDYVVVEKLGYIINGLELLSKLNKKGTADLTRFIQKLNSIFNTNPYLSKIAEIYLELINEVFSEIAQDAKGAKEKRSDIKIRWMLSKDTSWYSYLFATSIDKISSNPQVLPASGVGFDTIKRHPDSLGFIIEQREARASFDDWRFMNPRTIRKEENLAHIRSHDSDAFFGSEYQSFLYFPADPMFLMNQYEETVCLMMRLNLVLKHYNTLIYDLTREVRDRLSGNVKADETGEERVSSLRGYLQKITNLRLGAGKMISLTANAGISRYKDHGDLMEKIVDKMELDLVVESLDRHLGNLDVLTRNIVETLEAEREKRFERQEAERKEREAKLEKTLARQEELRREEESKREKEDTRKEAERKEREEKQARKFEQLALVLGLCFAAVAVDVLVKSISNFICMFLEIPSGEEARQAFDVGKAFIEAIFTIVLWALTGLVIFRWYKRRTGDESEDGV